MKKWNKEYKKVNKKEFKIAIDSRTKLKKSN